LSKSLREKPDAKDKRGRFLYWAQCADCPVRTLVPSCSLSRLVKKGEPYRCRACSSRHQHGYNNDEERQAAEQQSISFSNQKTRKILKSRLLRKIAEIKNRCAKKGWDFTLTINDLLELWDKQSGKCAVTKKPMLLRAIPEGYRRDPQSPSVDRIDSHKLYTKDNIRFVCWRVNEMKNDGTDEELFEWCEAVLLEREGRSVS
jgi:hypothetical protein